MKKKSNKCQQIILDILVFDLFEAPLSAPFSGVTLNGSWSRQRLNKSGHLNEQMSSTTNGTFKEGEILIFSFEKTLSLKLQDDYHLPVRVSLQRICTGCHRHTGYRTRYIQKRAGFESPSRLNLIWLKQKASFQPLSNIIYFFNLSWSKSHAR